jgi:putative membrane protein
MSSMAEIQLGRLAQERGGSDAVKQYGSKMIADHTQASMKLQQVVGGSVPLPSSLDAMHRQAMDMLMQMTGAQFDREYMRMMVQDHQEAVQRFQMQASTTSSGSSGSGSSSGAAGSGSSSAGAASSGSGTAQFAQQTLPVLQQHLQMAQQIQAQLQ